MQISKELPQFEHGEALLIVSGARSADVYRAKNGTIEKIKSLKTPSPNLPDKKEGFFTSSGKGQVIRSGFVYEKRKEKIEDKFIHEFEKEIKTLELGNASKIYAFAPKHVARRIGALLPKQSRAEQTWFYGNYQHAHPFDLIREIKKREAPKVALMREEARKILQKTQRAVKRKK